ncbi:Phox/Bem1p [Artemisia annua]|uniref:Phox/Bem1p n=1 Tax=Artemisia annua TaxID=35608 RepID=A0A2U1NXF5_ARTAN|nr:Phox/Bem1p [Artemisia annua]
MHSYEHSERVSNIAYNIVNGERSPDGAGTSLNIATHEPEHRSYFQKLGRDDFPNKDTSHIDQNQLAFSSGFRDVADGSVRSQLDSPNAFVNDASKDETPVAGSVFVSLQSRYDLSQVKISESMQFVDMVENTRIPESEYEEHVSNIAYNIVNGERSPDGAGTSLNIATHEPEHRSYFQKLGRDDFPNKDASHIDQNQLAFSSGF